MTLVEGGCLQMKDFLLDWPCDGSSMPLRRTRPCSQVQI